MTDDFNVIESNKPISNSFSNVEKQDSIDPDFSDRFILDGNKVTISLISDSELLLQQCPSGGILSPFINNFYKKSELISIENIIAIRCKDSGTQLSSRAELFRSKRSPWESLHGSYSGWLRLNQTLTISRAPARDKYATELSQTKANLVLPSSFEIPAYQGCGSGIVIDYVKKEANKKWKTCSICLHNSDHQVVDAWRNKLEECLLNASNDRPRKLLIFVNPFGGNREGKTIFNNQVDPLLRLSGVKFDVVITERANHAKEMLQKCSLDGIDGVVCVGGDGMFSEIFTGMLLRAANEANGDFTQLQKGKLRVGVIPAGSSDAIALAHHGTRCPITATLHIILGDRRNVDIMRVMEVSKEQETFRLFSLAMVSYGYFGDLLQSSEKLRWLGPKRYDISGAKTWLSNKGYEGKITFVLDETNPTNPTNLENRCLHRCPTCEEMSEVLNNMNAKVQDKSDDVTDKDTIDSPKDSTNKTHTIEGEFMSITGAVMSCMSPKSPKGLTPSAHLGDGNLDLIIVNKTSRVNYLRYLIRTNMPSSSNSPFQLPFVQVHRVKEFTFQPKKQNGNQVTNEDTLHNDISSKSVWNCDGELITSPSIHAKVYCQILPVFARGIE